MHTHAHTVTPDWSYICVRVIYINMYKKLLCTHWRTHACPHCFHNPRNAPNDEMHGKSNRSLGHRTRKWKCRPSRGRFKTPSADRRSQRHAFVLSCARRRVVSGACAECTKMSPRKTTVWAQRQQARSFMLGVCVCADMHLWNATYGGLRQTYTVYIYVWLGNIWYSKSSGELYTPNSRVVVYRVKFIYVIDNK